MKSRIEAEKAKTISLVQPRKHGQGELYRYLSTYSAVLDLDHAATRR